MLAGASAIRGQGASKSGRRGLNGAPLVRDLAKEWVDIWAVGGVRKMSNSGTRPRVGEAIYQNAWLPGNCGSWVTAFPLGFCFRGAYSESFIKSRHSSGPTSKRAIWEERKRVSIRRDA